MRKTLVQEGGLLLILAAMLLIVGCRAHTPSPFSPLSTPGAVFASTVPTPPIAGVRGKVLLQFGLADASGRGTLGVIDPDGGNLEVLAEVTPDQGSVAISPDQRYVAFFTSARSREGTLTAWDLQDGETAFQLLIPAEVSDSFRDALPVRYLAWSPDSESLAFVVGRDLHVTSLAQQDVRVVVRHREELYNMAGMVMGSIGSPVWTTDGQGIVFDAFSPPRALSAGADRLRDVRHVDVSTGRVQTLVEDAHIVLRLTAAGGEELTIEHDDGRYFSVSLSTLDVAAIVAPSLTEDAPVCHAQSRRCASVLTTEGDRDALRLRSADPGSTVQDVGVADLGDSTSECLFQSVIWAPDGDSLLVAVTCAGRVGLWSIGASDLTAVHQTDWAQASSLTLLAWFE